MIIDTSKYPFKFQWGLEHLTGHIDDLNKKIQELEKSLSNALGVSGNISLLPYKIDQNKMYESATYDSIKRDYTYRFCFTLEQVKEMQREDEEIIKKNSEIVNTNRNNLLTAITYLEKLGLKKTKQVRKNSRSYRTVEVNSDWYSELCAHFSTFTQENRIRDQYKTLISKMEEQEKLRLKAEQDFKEAQEREKRSSKLAQESIKKAIELNMDMTDLTTDEIIESVREKCAEKFKLANYPVGVPVTIDDNYCECETYFIGQPRCSCGNRRIDARIEGDILNGFRLVTEAY